MDTSPAQTEETQLRLPRHLKGLEAESIEIMREVAAESKKPAMLYSIGKDSSVMLHLAIKAFYPAKLPFPLLHVDTTWKFREMIAFRDETARRPGIDLLVHINQDGLARGIGPIASGSSLHTQVMKTEALKQALDRYGFDAAFGGARRDEEKSRAKERIFSFRSQGHVWDPRNQRPELWNLFNTRVRPGETIRVFPLSNWTELDVWRYIQLEGLVLPSIYFAHEREVFERDGILLAVSRYTLTANGETAHSEWVRYRTVGDLTITGAVRSRATDIEGVIAEISAATVSERGETRADDRTSAAAMEDRKREGYF
jgi:sulfate adenylyltransferase subunit 2